MVTKGNLVIKYLNNNYKVVNKRFFNLKNNEEEWGFTLVNTLQVIFSLPQEFVESILLRWASLFGLSENQFKEAIRPQKLKVKWSRETIQDLRVAYGVETAEEQITRLLVEEISREIDAQIIGNLTEEVNSIQDLEDLVKCIGYESTLLIDDNTLIPINGFQSITSTEMIKHRETSRIWENRK